MSKYHAIKTGGRDRGKLPGPARTARIVTPDVQATAWLDARDRMFKGICPRGQALILARIGERRTK